MLVTPHRRQLGREQPGLRSEVLLDGPVQVEMITSQIGEHRGVEPRAGDPPQCKGVRRDLHHDRVDALVTHRGEPFLQLGGLGGGADPTQCPDHTDVVTGRPQRGRDQVRGRRLAVRAGDPDRRQRTARLIVERGRDMPEHRPRVVDDDLGDGDGQLVVDEERRRTGLDRRLARTRARRDASRPRTRRAHRVRRLVSRA